MGLQMGLFEFSGISPVVGTLKPLHHKKVSETIESEARTRDGNQRCQLFEVPFSVRHDLVCSRANGHEV